ncbi:MAG: hypothetical protein ACFBSC_18165 [Microcoleaceae cyanobacterium]
MQSEYMQSEHLQSEHLQSEQIQQLVQNIDQALSESDPHPPWVVMGSAVLRSRQVLEQVRSYLLSQQLSPSSAPGSASSIRSAATQLQPSESGDFQTVLRQMLKQELQKMQPELLGTVQQEMKALRQNQAQLLHEIRQLQKYPQKSSRSPSPPPIPPRVSKRSSSGQASPPATSSSSNVAGSEANPVERGDDADPLPPSSQSSPNLALTPEPNLNLNPNLNLEISIGTSSDHQLSSEGASSEPPGTPAADSNAGLADVFGALTLEQSDGLSLVKQVSSPSVEEYVHASPEENLLPTEGEQEHHDWIQSHLFLDKNTLSQLEIDLMALEDETFEQFETTSELEDDNSEEELTVLQPEEVEPKLFDLLAEIDSSRDSYATPEAIEQFEQEENLTLQRLADRFQTDEEPQQV